MVKEPDEKPAAVINGALWKVLFIFMTTRRPQQTLRVLNTNTLNHPAITRLF